MLARKRIGNTFTVFWTVDTNHQAVSLEDRDLTLVMTDPAKRNYKWPFTIEDTNTVVFTYQGKDQTLLGTYTVSLYENMGSSSQTRVSTEAFQLVNRTALATG